MDDQLIELLQKIGDDFRPAQSYIFEWGYDIDPVRRIIPYKAFEEKPQIHGRNK